MAYSFYLFYIKCTKIRSKKLEQACNKHVDASCTILGVMYYHGDGLNQDKVKVAELFSKACDDKTNPNANACFYLGRMYHNAEGVAQDTAKAINLYAKAVELFTRACNATSVSACFNVAGIFRNGSGVPQDPSKALEFYNKACELNLQSACEQYSIQKGKGNVQKID